MPGFSERKTEDHVECEWIRGRSVNRPVEAKDEITFHKVTIEEAVVYRPTLDDQWCDSELCRFRLIGIHQESYPASDCDAVPHPPQESGIDNKLNLSWPVHDHWDEFKVKVHSSGPIYRDRYRKRHLEVVCQARHIPAVLSY